MRNSLKDPDLNPAIESLKSLRIGMTDASRRHLALRCRQVRPSAWGALMPRLGGLRFLPVPVPVAAGAMALLLAASLTVLMVGHQAPSDVKGYGETGYGETPVRLVNVVPAGAGGVTLEWRDGPKRTYTVLKSTDPRNFSGAETYAVKGTRWTDPSPSPGQVVYYRVE
jgi:hypothetical protein